MNFSYRRIPCNLVFLWYGTWDKCTLAGPSLERENLQIFRWQLRPAWPLTTRQQSALHVRSGRRPSLHQRGTRKCCWNHWLCSRLDFNFESSLEVRPNLKANSRRLGESIHFSPEKPVLHLELESVYQMVSLAAVVPLSLSIGSSETTAAQGVESLPSSITSIGIEFFRVQVHGSRQLQLTE